MGEEREGGLECVCKRDKVGDGRECESVRESKWWQRELIQDGGERESEIMGWESMRESRGWERESESKGRDGE